MQHTSAPKWETGFRPKPGIRSDAVRFAALVGLLFILPALSPAEPTPEQSPPAAELSPSDFDLNPTPQRATDEGVRAAPAGGLEIRDSLSPMVGHHFEVAPADTAGARMDKENMRKDAERLRQRHERLEIDVSELEPSRTGLTGTLAASLGNEPEKASALVLAQVNGLCVHAQGTSHVFTPHSPQAACGTLARSNVSNCMVQTPPHALRREDLPRRGVTAARALHASAPKTHSSANLLVLKVQGQLLDPPVAIQTQQQRLM